LAKSLKKMKSAFVAAVDGTDAACYAILFEFPMNSQWRGLVQMKNRTLSPILGARAFLAGY
jgi:hypothetical protein